MEHDGYFYCLSWHRAILGRGLREQKIKICIQINSLSNLSQKSLLPCNISFALHSYLCVGFQDHWLPLSTTFGYLDNSFLQWGKARWLKQMGSNMLYFQLDFLIFVFSSPSYFMLMDLAWLWSVEAKLNTPFFVKVFKSLSKVTFIIAEAERFHWSPSNLYENVFQL